MARSAAWPWRVGRLRLSALTYHIWGEQGASRLFSTLHLAIFCIVDPLHVGPALRRLTLAAPRGTAAAMHEVRTASQAMQLMARETRVRHAPVPRQLAGVEVPPGHDRIAEHQYLLRCKSGYAYHYRPGEGIAIERPSGDADPDEEYLWLNGSVYAAVACLNGLYPVHASAIEVDGQVHAFTGPSGAGKSTLVSALAQRGLPLFCDDTLLLEVTDPLGVVALPGHKRLKLTEHAIALTGLAGEQPVGAGTGKCYVAPPAGVSSAPLPLASLTLLAAGDALSWEPIDGARRLLALDDDHDLQRLYAQARQSTRKELFAVRSTIAAQVRMARLTRPLTSSNLAATVDFVLARIAASGTRL